MPDVTYAVSAANTRRTMWDVLWNAVALGGLDQVTPNLVMLLDPVKIGSLGKLKLDDRFVGLEDGSHVEVTIRECTIARIKALCPWISTTANIVPALNTLIAASYAQPLILHPHDLGSATTTEDLYFYKAVPVNVLNLMRDNQKDDFLKVTVNIYPDASKLPANPYGIIGAPA